MTEQAFEVMPMLRLLPPEDYSLEKFSEYIEKYGKEMTPEEKSRLKGYLKEYMESKSKE